MAYVIAAPEMMTAAAAEIATIGSTLDVAAAAFQDQFVENLMKSSDLYALVEAFNAAFLDETQPLVGEVFTGVIAAVRSTGYATLEWLITVALPLVEPLVEPLIAANPILALSLGYIAIGLFLLIAVLGLAYFSIVD